MRTLSGRQVYPDSTEAPTIEDVSMGLASTARFAGQTQIWYPVALHSIAVSIVVEDDHLQGLLHDIGEAVVGDQVSTWKNRLTKRDEQMVAGRMLADWGIGHLLSKLYTGNVAYADKLVLRAEAEILGHSDPSDFLFCEQSDHARDITEWLAKDYAGDRQATHELFLSRYEELTQDLV